MSLPLITFLSDYGLEDEFVGICHAVIAGICPQARVIDLSHGVPRHDVRAGALILRGALPYVPPGVHLAVVDPGVGGERRAIAMRLANGRLLVGPDNGLLWPAAEQAGGVTEAVDIACSPYRLQPVSATFHGRDIFAPVAAGLADGVALADVGERCDPGELVRLVLPVPRLEDGMLVAHAVYVDRFGNVQLDAPHDGSGLEPGRGVTLELPSGETHRALFVATFADVAQGELLVYEDAHRMLAVAINRGNAAERLGIVVDDELAMRSE